MMKKKPIRKVVTDKAYRPDRDGPKKRPTVTNKPLPATPKPTVKPITVSKPSRPKPTRPLKPTARPMVAMSLRKNSSKGR